MTVSPQSRIRILNTPVLAPGVCCLCGSAGDDKRTFVDFGKQLDWYGAVYFCSECINECVLATGHVKVSLFKQLDNELQDLKLEYRSLTYKFEAVKNVLHYLSSDIVDRGPMSVDDFVQCIVDALEKPRAHEGTTSDSDVDDSDSDESCNIEGSVDIQHSTDLGLLPKAPRPRKSPEV